MIFLVRLSSAFKKLSKPFKKKPLSVKKVPTWFNQLIEFIKQTPKSIKRLILFVIKCCIYCIVFIIRLKQLPQLIRGLPTLIKYLPTLIKQLPKLIRNLPRKHFIALVLLVVFVSFISFMPSKIESTKNIRRHLMLPNSEIVAGTGSFVEPNTSITTTSPATIADYLGNREVEIEIKKGDTVSAIFQRERLPAGLLQELLEVDEQYLRLGNLLPGQKLKLLISADEVLLSLKVEIDLSKTLVFTRKNNEYIAELETKQGEWRHSVYKGTINNSFYVDAKQAGLSAGQIQQISGALQEKLNFSRNLHPGDTFTLLVSKEYIDGQYTKNSEVLAALIDTRHRTYKAFLHDDGRYYDEDGFGLSKAYRRFPFNGRYRISSPFNLKRLHPITKRLSPHHGTDFAVPWGTKVFSIGDGVVTRVGNHPAAGKYIVINHGRKYTTRYLHLSKIYVHKGQHLKMGELIAKSGNTGRSTGPHLHFEIHLYGRPVDPMKIKLPLSKAVSKKQKPAFIKRRDLFLKEMGQ